METTTEKVTPKKAEAWLNANNNNRNLRPGLAEVYAKDMREGNWTQCTAPIAFYDDNDLADGQHRLYAIVESETTQTFIVIRGLPREAGLNIDTGARRTAADAAVISGLEPTANNTLIAAARAIAEGKATKGSRSNIDKLLPLQKWREPAMFASTHVPRIKYLGSSPVLGAIGRAWLHEQDRERLRRFCAVMKSGFMEHENESAAIAIRNYLQVKGGQASLGANWEDTFLKVQNAIYYFMRGRKLHYIKAVSAETYPLPGSVDYKPLRGYKPTSRLNGAEARA